MSARASLRFLIVAAAWAALVAGCKAEFTSGVTVCGQKEPRCPSGFVCVNDLRCVKMDQVNVDRLDGGTKDGPDAAGPTMMGPFTPPISVDAAPLLDAAPPPPDATAVASDAGATAIDAAAGPDMAPIPVGQAVVKFCNGLRRVDGSSLDLELAIGSLRLKAGTRQCTPGQGMPCGGLPAGPVTAQLLRDGTVVATKQLTLDQSGQYLLGPNIDAATQKFTIDETKLAVGQVCGNFSFPAIARVKFCNRLALSDAMGNPVPVVLDLVIGTTKLTAGTGQCNTMEGLGCDEIRAGMAKLSLQRNGTEATSVTTTLGPDGSYAVLGEFDAATKGPKLTVIPLGSGNTCPAYKPPPLPAGPPSDAGADSAAGG